MQNTRIGSVYTFIPCFFDRAISEPFGVKQGILKSGDKVKVIKPKLGRNTRQCYIENMKKEFCGMCMNYSLFK